jgi:Bacterial PH domain
LSRQNDPDGTQVFRSPAATAIWWLWVLFAVGNLIDLAVQGRDRLSVVAACTLLVVTGLVYATAKRPRIIADVDGVTIVNPIRVHRVGWPAVAGFDATELLRVRCSWLAKDGTASEKHGFYAWAAHSSRRRQVAAQLRAKRQAQGRSSRVRFGAFGAPPPNDAPPPAPLGLDVEILVATLTERAEKARSQAPDARPEPPVSTWSLATITAVLAPSLALLVVALL